MGDWDEEEVDDLVARLTINGTPTANATRMNTPTLGDFIQQPSNNENKRTGANYFEYDSRLQEAHPFYSSQPVVRILKKTDTSGSNNSSPTTNPSNEPKMQQSTERQLMKSLEEREREYAKARAAIFSQPITENTSTPTMVPNYKAERVTQLKTTAIPQRTPISSCDFDQAHSKQQSSDRKPKGFSTAGRGSNRMS